MNNLNKLETPDADRRYMVGWEAQTINGLAREIVIVFDRVAQKIVYKSISSSRLSAYPKIKDFFGVGNCVKPKPVKIRMYE